MAVLTPTPKQQIFNSDGTPLAGGKIYTYAAGTSTPIATYTDYSAGTANTNPVILNSLGQANIWLLTSASYKFIVKDADDVLLYTVDNILPPLDNSSFSSPPPIGNVTPNTASFTTLTLTGTGASKLNVGSTAQRPGGVNGMIRYNVTTSLMEGYINSAWRSLGLVTTVNTGTGLQGGPITSTGTITIDNTVVTKTGFQDLSEKTLVSPVFSGTPTGVGVLTSGTAVSPSTSSIDFTGIPSWAKRITLMFNNVSTNGSSNIQIQLGSGSPTTSGYSTASLAVATGSTIVSTTSTGFLLPTGAASAILFGSATFSNLSGNSWTGSLSFGQTDTARIVSSFGGVTLSGVLDRLRVTTVSGSDNFDSGTMNILYE